MVERKPQPTAATPSSLLPSASFLRGLLVLLSVPVCCSSSSSSCDFLRIDGAGGSAGVAGGALCSQGHCLPQARAGRTMSGVSADDSSAKRRHTSRQVCPCFSRYDTHRQLGVRRPSRHQSRGVHMYNSKTSYAALAHAGVPCPTRRTTSFQHGSIYVEFFASPPDARFVA